MDNTLGRFILSKPPCASLIDEGRVHLFDALDNRWAVVLIPLPWRCELVESWYPSTAWNLGDSSVRMMASHEIGSPRRQDAEIGGCSYQARLAVNESLQREGYAGRQAGADRFMGMLDPAQKALEGIGDGRAASLPAPQAPSDGTSQ